MDITGLIHSVTSDIILKRYILILSYHLHRELSNRLFHVFKLSPTFSKFCPRKAYWDYYPKTFGGDKLWTCPVRTFPQPFYTSSFSGFWLQDTFSKTLILQLKL